MKTFLSGNITESQTGEFPDWTNQLGSFPSVPDFTISLRFHSLQLSGAITRRELALFSGALLALSRDDQLLVQVTDKIFHCPSILHTCQCSMPELVTLSFSTKSQLKRHQP